MSTTSSTTTRFLPTSRVVRLRFPHTQNIFVATLHENRHASESKPEVVKKGNAKNSERGIEEDDKIKKSKSAGPKAPKSGRTAPSMKMHVQEDAGLRKSSKVKAVVEGARE